MAARPHTPPAPATSSYLLVFLIGLLAFGLGVGLLILSFEQRSLRLPGAACVLLGVIVCGGYLTNKLFSGLYNDPLAYEPPWAKLGRGEGLPRLPAPGKLAAPPAAPVAMEKLVDFPEPVAPPRPSMTISKPAARPSTPAVWTAELFDRMSPHQFDAVCATLFAQSGLEARVQSHGPAGGVTLWLYSRHTQTDKNNPVAVAVCRLWQGQTLAVRQLHPLVAMMTARQLKRATYATASTFTEDARKFAKDNGINALDRSGLLALIAKRTPLQQQTLFAQAFGKR
ncbi:MAG: restriction endonuclease [Pseudomonadota bacterium]|nr:restriction endonuclease [Pseudomonadota bacterium]